MIIIKRVPSDESELCHLKLNYSLKGRKHCVSAAPRNLGWDAPVKILQIMLLQNEDVGLSKGDIDQYCFYEDEHQEEGNLFIRLVLIVALRTIMV